MNARIPGSAFKPAQALDEVGRAWDRDIVAQLTQYIRIPAKPPAFDEHWATHGYLDQVVHDAATWGQAQKIEGLKLEVIRLEGRTPVLFFELPASHGAGAAPRTTHAGQTVLMYGQLEDNVSYQAVVSFDGTGSATGWNALTSAPWFEQALQDASQSCFGAPCGYIGQGGTIPLMNILARGFPKAQRMVCGVLGPKSNAHGPNEFLHVPYACRLTAAVAQVIAQMR